MIEKLVINFTAGGGLPVGAYGGRREIMEMVAPNGPVYQAGACVSLRQLQVV